MDCIGFGLPWFKWSLHRFPRWFLWIPWFTSARTAVEQAA